MAKRTFRAISSGAQAWDADVEANFDTSGRLFPIPLYEPSAGLFANLPAANQNDAGLAIFTEGSPVSDKLLTYSNGTTYLKVGKQAATNTPFTDNIGGTVNDTLAAIADPANSPATADALRDDLVANALPAIRNALSSLAAKHNTVRTNARAAGQVA